MENTLSTFGWAVFFLFLALPLQGNNLNEKSSKEPTEEIERTEIIEEAIVVAPRFKGAEANGEGLKNIIARTTLTLQTIRQLEINDIHDLSAIIPGLHIPDYGSRMTSSIYIRGLGSRIDQPAMGVYIDGIPLLNKNSFDFEPTDIRSIDVLRGPQGTLYGRNTMGGVIDITTLSPIFTGKKTRLLAEYGSYNHHKWRIAHYDTIDAHRGYSVAALFRHRDGAYINTATGESADREDAGAISGQYEQQGDVFSLRSTMTADYTRQSGYPYRQLLTETAALNPIAYGDDCSYRRLSIMSGHRMEWDNPRHPLIWVATLAHQYLDDKMHMDNDFTTEDIFILTQAQRENTINLDLTFRPRTEDKGGKHTQQKRWEWLSGINLWGKNLSMSAPVVFKEEGIDRLILSNANHGLQMAFPNAELSFSERTFPIESDFKTLSYGLAIYHNSSFKLSPHWTITAGLRIEHERQLFDYDSKATIHYILKPYITTPIAFQSRLKGDATTDFTELSPSFTTTWKSNTGWTWHTSISRGYKAGGFNTQLFSDLVQQDMMQGLRKAMGLSIEEPSTQPEEIIRYRPEYSWNYETGLRYEYHRGEVGMSIFYTDCRDQQLTVFPAGMQTGRMMTNAGKTRSYGFETTLQTPLTSLECDIQGKLGVSYGYTHATFRHYISGGIHYEGNYLPYTPQHTLATTTDWRLPAGFYFHADYRACGPIYWDDANLHQQEFYGLCSASIEWRHNFGISPTQRGTFSIKLWGKNLCDTGYRTFYFVSMQNHFLQEGRPREMGITLSQEF